MNDQLRVLIESPSKLAPIDNEIRRVRPLSAVSYSYPTNSARLASSVFKTGCSTVNSASRIIP